MKIGLDEKFATNKCGVQFGGEQFQRFTNKHSFLFKINFIAITLMLLIFNMTSIVTIVSPILLLRNLTFIFAQLFIYCLSIEYFVSKEYVYQFRKNTKTELLFH